MNDNTTTDHIKPGDQVTWTRIFRSGATGYHLSTRHGRVDHITDGFAHIRQHGKTCKVRVEKLRLKGQITELTQVVTAVP